MGRRPKRGLQAYLETCNGRVNKTLVVGWITEEHRCWTTNGCVGLKKTWRRLQLSQPVLTKYITFREMKLLLHDRLPGRDCGLRNRIGRRDILNAEQKHDLDSGRHVYGFQLVRHPIQELMSHATHVILLDQSRSHSHKQQLLANADDEKNPCPLRRLVSCNPGTSESSFNFWVALVLHFDHDIQTGRRRVVFKRVLVIPWTTNSLTDVLHFPELWILLNEPLGPSYNLFVDQAPEIQFIHVRDSRNMLLQGGGRHELHIQPYGLKNQRMQCLVEGAISLVKICRNKAIATSLNQHLILENCGSSMSKTLYEKVRTLVQKYSIAN